MKVPNIRFNLKFFDERGAEIVIRTIEDLKQNLNVSDLYAYMVDGTLERWLRSLRETELAERIDKAKAQADIRKKIRALLSAFDFEVDGADIEAFIASLCHTNTSRLKSEYQHEGSDVKQEAPAHQFVDKLVDAIKVFKTKDEAELRSSISSLFENYEEKMVDLLRTYNPTTCKVEVVGLDHNGLNTLEAVAKPTEADGRAALCRGRGRDRARPSRGFATASLILPVDFMALVMLIAWTNPRLRSRVDLWYTIRFEASSPSGVSRLRLCVSRFRRNKFTGFPTEDGSFESNSVEVNYVTNWLDEKNISRVSWSRGGDTLGEVHKPSDPVTRNLECAILKHFSWV